MDKRWETGQLTGTIFPSLTAKEMRERKGQISEGAGSQRSYFVCLFVFKMKDLCVFVCFKGRSQWLKSWEGKYPRKHSLSMSHEGFYLNQQKENKQARIWEGFFFLRVKSMDMCRWTGVTRGDSISPKGLNAILKNKKQNKKTDFYPGGNQELLKSF